MQAMPAPPESLMRKSLLRPMGDLCPFTLPPRFGYNVGVCNRHEDHFFHSISANVSEDARRRDPIEMTKRVYLFEEGNARMRDLLGGKGANLAEMTHIGLPVPPGFTITTETCNEYYAAGKKLPDGLMEDVRKAIGEVEKKMDRQFG